MKKVSLITIACFTLIEIGLFLISLTVFNTFRATAVVYHDLTSVDIPSRAVLNPDLEVDFIAKTLTPYGGTFALVNNTEVVFAHDHSFILE